uniref:hypothetical protein n=1 Tax=Escherichia coli TaxID=562 RepID=UPI00128FFDFF
MPHNSSNDGRLAVSRMPDSEIETIIRSRRIGYWHVGDILDRLFREEGVSGLKSIESIRLSDLSGFTTAWAVARNEAPIAATVGEHIKTAARMMWYEF